MLEKHIHHRSKGQRIENQQLIGQVLKEIVPTERFAALREMVFETREIRVDLPKDMRRQQSQGQKASDIEFAVFQQLEVGKHNQA